MREIKFRAWHKELSRFINEKTEGMWTLRLYDDGSFTVYSSRKELIGDDDSVILTQFTGLHDKNGKEIYEGDILQYKRDRGFYLISRQSEKEDECGFICERHKPNYNYMLSPVWKEMKIVGNIYENPELVSPS
jgi:uncharacterized phage protein (TIGR01671 family)